MPLATGRVHAARTSLTLTAEQVTNAATIAQVARDRGLPDRAIVIALATAQQESRLRNLDYGDRDSLGLFQQRPSQGWGTEAQVQDPVYAAGKFYDGLVKVPDWERAGSPKSPRPCSGPASPRPTSSGRRWREELRPRHTSGRRATVVCGCGTRLGPASCTAQSPTRGTCAAPDPQRTGGRDADA